MQQIGQAHVQGIFVIYEQIPLTDFSLYFGEKIFWWIWRENTWVPPIFFPSPPSNQIPNKKVFLFIFSPKFSIHPISPLNKHTSFGKKEWIEIKWIFLEYSSLLLFWSFNGGMGENGFRFNEIFVKTPKIPL